jgi:hypothetical protein
MMVCITACVHGQVSDFYIPETTCMSSAVSQFNEIKQIPNAYTSVVFQKIIKKNLPIVKSSEATKLKLDSIVVKSVKYDKNPSRWVGLSKDTYTYDSLGNMVRYINYNWDNNIKKRKITKNDFSYTADGKLAQLFYYVLDNTTNIWSPVTKDEYTYDVNGNLTLDVWYTWNAEENKWQAKLNTNKSYGSDGNLTDEVWGSGQAVVKIEYSYDDRNNMIQYIRYSRDNASSLWIAAYKKVFTYDKNNNRIQYIYYDRDMSKTQWQESSKEEYKYGTNGNLIQDIRYNWNIFNKQWVVEWKYEYDYDDSYSFSDLLIPDLEYFYYSFCHKLDSFVIFYWETSLKQWIPDQRGILYYSGNNIKTKSESEIIRVYPNPVSKILCISLPWNYSLGILELFNAAGKKVLTKKINGVQKVNVEKLTPGMYLYKLIIDGERYTGKLIKQ